MKGLNGKNAIVTGGGRGIGAAIIERLYEEGVSAVAILDFDRLALQKATQAHTAQHRNCIGIACDVGDAEDVKRAVGSAVEQLTHIDILINNAGITQDAMLHKMKQEQWDAVIRVNLSGTYHFSREVFPLMRAQKSGTIINISSTSAWGNIGQANYTASKSGVLGLTKTLAMEGGMHNIRVNSIAPGMIQTDMLSTIPEKMLEKFKDTTLLKRLGDPSEVASVAAFLASDDAGFITGQCISVSGGLICL